MSKIDKRFLEGGDVGGEGITAAQLAAAIATGQFAERTIPEEKWRNVCWSPELGLFCAVGAQIMCWTFIIQYGTRIFMCEGMSEQAAEVLSQRYNIYAMLFFICSRFLCTYLMKYFRPPKLLAIFAVGGMFFTAGVIFLQNRYGVYCLVAVSGCMSLMFPTIYGIALRGLGDDAKFGAAGLIMAILGGSVLPPLQASIIDLEKVGGMPAVHVSFVLPFICFAVVCMYGLRAYKCRHTATERVGRS